MIINMARNTDRNGKASRRPAPTVAKQGVTRNGKRRFGCGGKLHCNGGRLKK